ncbi:MAG: 30S ribosomal protein S7 [Candidatus Micrarchaeota archaeon]
MKIFGKYETDGIEITDLSLKQTISLKPINVPHSHGRHAKKPFAKQKINIVERLANKLMRGGTGEKTGGKVIRTGGKMQGKKIKALRLVENAFDIIAKQTNENPIQVLIKALQNSAPREDVTRVALGGVSYQVATDISGTRRLDLALRNITLAAIMGSFNKNKALDIALANEILSTAKGDLHSSYAMRKRDEMERMARSAR